MNLFKKDNLNRIILFFCLTLFSAIIFQFASNILFKLNLSSSAYFSEFEKNSEALVLGTIVADDYGLDKKGANLGFISKDGIFKYPDNAQDVYAIIFGETESAQLGFKPYKSQYGIQGVFFSKIHSLFGLSKLYQLQSINSILLAIVIVSLFSLYRHIYDELFAAIFLITMLSSVWVVAFARNLYWAPFLWFVPALLAAILYTKRNTKVRALLLFGIAFAVFIKSLAGYEYLSTITLFACSVFVVAPFFKYKEQKSSINWAMLFLVFTACVIGFFGALLVHASMSIKGDSIITGLQNIYELDVKRRTYGDPSSFLPQVKDSLDSSPFSVLKIYIIDWKIPLVAWLPGKYFKLLFVFSLVGIFFQFWKKHPTRQRDAVLWSFFFLVSTSWFVLAKAHSYVHTHLNFVLWYFGFVQALFYVSLNSANAFRLSFIERMKTKGIKDY